MDIRRSHRIGGGALVALCMLGSVACDDESENVIVDPAIGVVIRGTVSDTAGDPAAGIDVTAGGLGATDCESVVMNAAPSVETGEDGAYLIDYIDIGYPFVGCVKVVVAEHTGAFLPDSAVVDGVHFKDVSSPDTLDLDFVLNRR